MNVDDKFFDTLEEDSCGWLCNVVEQEDGISLYFIENNHKTTIKYQPYFYVIGEDQPKEVEFEVEYKMDLSQNNHLNSKRKVLKVFGHENKKKVKGELREHDITNYCRFLIDSGIRVGLWYDLKISQGNTEIKPRADKIIRAEPVVLAFDIETTKLPLKFPDSSFDSIIMISYMIDGMGFLITNQQIVSQPIDDFEYTPKKDMKGEFQVFNEENEYYLLRRFLDHIITVKPQIYVTYNGDFFDWPFIEDRCRFHGINMFSEIGVQKNNSGEYLCSYGSHMDCLYWVKRDSYLPQGSQNLKAVATHKLGYNPMEIDPEDMTRFAAEKPQVLAQYSVSDAVATFYLYKKYVHPFIFSLCNIIPMNPDDVLRRGSGTLCEHLLMVQAHLQGVLMPNKHVHESERFWDGHLINSETYVGGHVEALEAGVFRSDLKENFKLLPDAFVQLISEIDAALKFTITKEGGYSLSDIENYDEVINFNKIKTKIVSQLEELRDNPNRKEEPLIYHLDVGAMYPNIILTNRLQPDAMVTDSNCATCDYNEGPNTNCMRKMQWLWRGEYFLSSTSEYNMLRNQLEQEKFPPKFGGGPERAYHELPVADQQKYLKKRMADYTRKVYGKMYKQQVIEQTSIVCQREHPFYIDTVRQFRDRRYEYKALLKNWKKKLSQAQTANDVAATAEAERMIVIFDSLQLAHKCILNSFYGYVMRKGARWYSMEMAGIVCLTGSKIIQLARQRVDQIGRPLELDTDGIWCILPKSFPENFTFKLKGGKEYSISYPCVMLNHLVHDEFTNDQYMVLDKETQEYSVKSENSIFFEVDGPYRAMILPASTEEDKLLKKRYCVFNDDGTVAELKGFEIKRRGELKLIKNFQASIFKVFLEGSSLEECYNTVGGAADSWIDILDSHGAEVTDFELFELLTENRNMSKALAEYGTQKSTSITAARRLAELLGDTIVKNKGLACKFLISAKPTDLPVSQRAVPIAIFQSPVEIRNAFLSKWLKVHSGSPELDDVRDIIDWDYYIERFGSVIQKLITIPAASQGISNPVPRIKHPDWLARRIASSSSKVKQLKINEFFKKVDGPPPMENTIEAEKENQPTTLVDLEDIMSNHVPKRLENGKRHLKTPLIARKRQKKQTRPLHPEPPSQNPFNIHTQYLSWLVAQKPIWAQMHQEQSKKRKPVATTKLAKYFSGASSVVETHTWQILQVSETDIQGVFRLFVIVNGTFESIDIDVPRLLYLNSRVENLNGIIESDIEISRVTRVLPRGHPSYFLYELKMSEYVFLSGQNAFSAMVNHKDVAGVYETQIPLVFRALISLGNFVKPVVGRYGLDRTRPISLDQLNAIRLKSNLYLGNSEFDIVYFYHSKSATRHFMALFVLRSNELTLFSVDQTKNSEKIHNVNRIYEEILKSSNDAQSQDQIFSYPSEIVYNSSNYTTEKDMLVAVNQKLLKLKNIKRPHIIMMQTIQTAKYYRNGGVAALREFPSMFVPPHKSDAEFPAFNWMQFCLQRMLGHFFNLREFLEERLQLARYSDVPVCNLESDSTLFLSDLFLARRLKKLDYILWCSPSPKPDLGGSEQDDNQSFLQDFKFTEINKPAIYPKLCIELEVWDLALHTLLKSVIFGGDLEASAQLNAKGNIHLLDNHLKLNKKVMAKNLIADSESPHAAVNQIRLMIKDWVEQVRTGNKFASYLLEHLHRWITNRSALFYDGLIVSHVYTLMKRVFEQLLNELENLGSTVIYASFEKIILQTNKVSPSASLGYMSYVLATMAKNSSFEHIELKPSGVWDYLIWYDSENYSAFSFQSVLENFPEIVEFPESKLEMHWNIAESLPPRVEKLFIQAIAEYQVVVQNLKIENRIEDLGKFIENEFKMKLLQCVSDIQARKFDDDLDIPHEIQYAFPKMPGVREISHDPALEFINAVSMVLGLDKSFEKETRILKRDLLKLIDVPEFSHTAVFTELREKYLLPQIICDYCNYCCDLDLTVKSSNNAPFLSCHGCSMVYDRDEIEQLLIQELNNLVMKWQLQDLTCSKCNQIRAELLPEYCMRCNGILQTSKKKELVIRKVELLVSVASYYRLNDLEEYCHFVLHSK